MVYTTPATALKALAAFTDLTPQEVSQAAVQQMLPAKAFPAHPDIRLEVRLAILGDRKQPGARDRSRFYLFNPDHDPATRRKKEGGGRRSNNNKYRDRDDEGYQSRRYDDYEHRRRQDGDDDAGFNVNLYDDDTTAIAARPSRRPARRSSRSSFSSQGEQSDGEARRVRGRAASGKELFPDRVKGKAGGRLRDRSASPVRDGLFIVDVVGARPVLHSSTKEVFPNKTAGHVSRRSFADPPGGGADLFAKRHPDSLLTNDRGSVQTRNTVQRLANPKTIGASLEDRISSGLPREYNIRGQAKHAAQEFSIKGAAGGTVSTKELFPDRLGGNSGKELFSARLEGRGAARRKAEDMFY